MAELSEDVYQCYNKIIKTYEFDKECSQVVFPRFPEHVIDKLCKSVTTLFQEEPVVLSVSGPCIIVGDLHGHLIDLMRILKKHGMPLNHSYLFLGDIVDRGEFSLETLILVFALKIKYPQNVFVIRGNHEFEQMYSTCGFYKEIMSIYSKDTIISSFETAFSFLPLAGIVGVHHFCIHGGIGPAISSLSNLYTELRPISDFNSEKVSSAVWSDPLETIEKPFVPSNRGKGYFFNKKALSSFLQTNYLKTLIRGHEMIQEGVVSSFDGMLYTVFSASNYCGSCSNKSGVLVIHENSSITTHTFEPSPYVKRKSAQFSHYQMILEKPNKKINPSCSFLPSIAERRNKIDRAQNNSLTIVTPASFSSPNLKLPEHCYPSTPRLNKGIPNPRFKRFSIQ